MKLIIQRVSKATVKITETNRKVGSIGHGLFVLVGIKRGDTIKNADFLTRKLMKIRLMADKNGKMNKTVSEVDGQFLVVSQFTLYANTKDGNRPSFIDAEEPQKAKDLYNYFISQLKSLGSKVQTGSFGEYMKINCSLDGPVTIILEAQ